MAATCKSISPSSIDFGYPTPPDGPVPAFNSIEEEAEFWDAHNLTDFIREDTGETEFVLGPELRRGMPETENAENPIL